MVCLRGKWTLVACFWLEESINVLPVVNDKIGGSSGLPITLIHHVTLSIRIQP